MTRGCPVLTFADERGRCAVFTIGDNRGRDVVLATMDDRNVGDLMNIVVGFNIIEYISLEVILYSPAPMIGVTFNSLTFNSGSCPAYHYQG